MKRIFVTDDTKRINLGFRGENEVREIVFDLSDLISDYGEGTAVLLAKRSQDISAYQVSEIVQSGTTLTWTVNQDIDSAYAGNGQAEIFWYLADEALAKTKVYPTYCTMDIGVPSQTPPDPYETWIDTLTELGAETLANAQAAQDAQTAAETAQGKAEDAQEAAETAQGKAEDAQTAAEYAQGKAEDAQEAAETAQGLAEDAQEGAEAARDQAQDILDQFTSPTASAETLAPNSQATASYSHGEFHFGIPQGEKGDTGNTGAAATIAVGTVTTGAAGSNAEVTNVGSANDAIFNFKIPKGDKGNTGATGADGYSPSASVSKSGTTTTITITDKDGTTTAEVEDGITPTVDNALSPTSENPVQNKVVTTSKADIITDTAQGSIASFPDGSPYPVLDLSVGIEPVQDLHGYSNPWPAGGGSNIWDEQWESGSLGGADGQPTADDTRIRSKNFNACLPSTQYYCVNSLGALNVAFYDADKNYISMSGNATNTTFTTPATCYYFKIRVVATSYTSGIAVNYPSSIRTYAPYSNICPIQGWTGANIYVEDTYDPTAEPTVSVSWQSEAATVYGGTLDVMTGKLVVDRAVVALNTLSFTQHPNNQNVYYTTGITGKKYGIYNLISDMFKTDGSAAASLPIGCMRGLNNNVTVYFSAPVTTKTAFESLVANSTLVYELATPLTYQLTAQQVSTLLGENNIWADTGEVSVTYRADTQRYIQKLTGSTEEDMIANTNIAANKYFMVGGNLYYSTASIASGETIKVGTNCNATNLAEALNALNA